MRLLAKTIGTALIMALSLVQTGHQVKEYGNTPQNAGKVAKRTAEVILVRPIVVEPQLPKHVERDRTTSTMLSARGSDSILQYGAWMDFVATAYDGQAGINGTGTGLTATGKRVAVGMVAVDPSVIPLGTEIEVELGDGSVEFLKAEDTGGAILGNRIDIFNPSYTSCIKFGRQNVRVRIVKGRE